MTTRKKLVILSQEDEDKPIYNIRMYSEQIKETRKKPDNILSWTKANLCSYLRGVFDSRGLIYINESNGMILSIQSSDMNKLELYQNALQKLNISSFIYYPQKENELGEMYIVGELNLDRFQKQIGFVYPKEVDFFYNYHKTMDWDD